MSDDTRRYFAFLFAPLGVVVTFFVATSFVHGMTPPPPQESPVDPWIVLNVVFAILAIGWFAELLLALPLRSMATRAGWMNWSATFTIGAGVGAIVALLLLKLFSGEEDMEAPFIAGWTIGGIASTALYRAIAPASDNEVDSY